ncbi:sensor histidine kinase [Haloglomus litoreum]|uniref:sensor histidine kinase n=1 Tax=Haloglomus litoreum TaxID=3034026 RepID=UPI0023E75B63|nr:ATP-binding protein [Haloglomus sp. DT116]
MGNDTRTGGEEAAVGELLPPEGELREGILEISPVPIAILDSDRKVVLANDRAKQELGLSEDELLGLSTDDSSLSAVDEDGEPVGADEGITTDILETGESVQNRVYRIDMPTGDAIWLSISGTPLLDDDGAVEHIVLAFENITERKERERRFDAVFNHTYQFTGLMEPDGTLIEANETALQFVGAEREEVVGVHLAEAPWITDDNRDRVRDAVDRAREGEFVRFEMEINSAGDADTVPIDFSLKPFTDEYGDVTLLIPEGRDITELKEREHELAEKTEELERTVDRLERTNAELEQFAYVASHDLQEPLRMISSYLDLLELEYEDALDEEAHEYIEYAVDGADRMREMIDDLLAFSRVQTREEEFEVRPVEAVLNEARDNLALAIEEADATITHDDLPTMAVDAHQLRQLFQNLLDNAISYAGDDPPRVHVGATEHDDHWEFAVADEGVGIPEEEQDRIFDIFMRGAGTEEGGSGIGLAICKRVVENHGGRIWVESEAGEGTTFRFTLAKEPAGNGGVAA